MSRRRLAIAVPYVALTWLFGGGYGALAGVAIVLLWVSLGPFGRALWALSVAFLIAAAVATITEGVPSGSVVGGVGPKNIIAHVLVGLALATAGLAGMAELAGERNPQSRRPSAATAEPPPEPAAGGEGPPPKA